jgi:hypothetical protein
MIVHHRFSARCEVKVFRCVFCGSLRYDLAHLGLGLLLNMTWIVGKFRREAQKHRGHENPL